MYGRRWAYAVTPPLFTTRVFRVNGISSLTLALNDINAQVPSLLLESLFEVCIDACCLAPAVYSRSLDVRNKRADFQSLAILWGGFKGEAERATAPPPHRPQK